MIWFEGVVLSLFFTLFQEKGHLDYNRDIHEMLTQFDIHC